VDNLPGESSWYLFIQHDVAAACMDTQYMSNGMSVRCMKN